MIAISVKSKKELRGYIGENIDHLIRETSMFNKECKPNVKNLPFVYPAPLIRKGFGQITLVDGILESVK